MARCANAATRANLLGGVTQEVMIRTVGTSYCAAAQWPRPSAEALNEQQSVPATVAFRGVREVGPAGAQRTHSWTCLNGLEQDLLE